MNHSNALTSHAVQQSLRGLSAKERISAIIAHSDAPDIVRSLPAEDLLITLKEVGLQDTMEIVELLSTEQVVALVDLDAWQGPRLNPVALAEWLSALWYADPHRAVEHFKHFDISLISLLLKQYARVFDTTLEEEPMDDGYAESRTPDNRYVVVFVGKEEEYPLLDNLHRILESLYGTDMSLAFRLIEGVRWETATQLEEEALKWRDARLQDMGFLPTDEVASVLAYMDPDLALSQIKNDPVINIGLASSLVLPPDFHQFPILQKGLYALAANKSESVYLQLVTTINRVHQALYGSFGELDHLKKSTLFTLSHIEISLPYLSELNNREPADLLTAVPAMRLFQTGHSLCLRVGRQFRKLLANQDMGFGDTDLRLIDTPLRETVAGVNMKEPQYFSGLTDPQRLDYRFFQSLDDVVQVTRAVAEAVFRLNLLGRKHLDLLDAPGDQVCGVRLATWVCNWMLDGEASLAPFNQARLIRLSEKLTQERRFSKEDRQIDHPSLTPRARQYMDIALGAVEEELSRISQNNLDTRFIGSLVLDK